MKFVSLLILLTLSGCVFSPSKEIEIIQDTEKIIEDSVELILDVEDTVKGG